MAIHLTAKYDKKVRIDGNVVTLGEDIAKRFLSLLRTEKSSEREQTTIIPDQSLLYITACF